MFHCRNIYRTSHNDHYTNLVPNFHNEALPALWVRNGNTMLRSNNEYEAAADCPLLPTAKAWPYCLVHPCSFRPMACAIPTSQPLQYASIRHDFG